MVRRQVVRVRRRQARQRHRTDSVVVVMDGLLSLPGLDGAVTVAEDRERTGRPLEVSIEEQAAN